MTNANKSYGSNFETDVVAYLRSRGTPSTRIARTVPDEGDVAIGDQPEFVAQLKANRDANTSASLGARLTAARKQADQFASARGTPQVPVPVVIIKQPRKPIGKAFVVMYLEDFINDGNEDV